MPEKAAAVANTFLDLALTHARSIDHLQLQKLVYFAHGWYLAIEDEPLLDELIEAWEHGPVVNSIYQQFKRFGSRPVHGRAWYFDPTTDAIVYPYVSNSEARDVIRTVWDNYSKYDGLQLSAMTHTPDSPWSAARAEMGWAANAHISNERIADYFREQAQRNRMRNEPSEAT